MIDHDKIIELAGRHRDVEKYSFVVEYSPPIVRPPLTEAYVLDKPPVDLYVHIPNCPYICDFCSFYKVKGMQKEQMDGYINAVKQELDLYLEKTDVGKRDISTLFYGGGTPTTLTPKQFSELTNYLRENLSIIKGSEFSIESTPDTLTDEILESVKANGVNRLSIGVQDFNDEVLQARNRGHTRKEAIDAFGRARRHGFDKINIDLIYRLPKQTFDAWENNLKIIKELEPDYITLYHLRKEKRTPIGKLSEKDFFPTKEQAMEMYLRALEFLVDLGYVQISAQEFAKPQKEFKQQENKWHYSSELLGLGISAYSWFNGHSFRNVGRFGGTTTVDDYIKIVEAGHPPIESGELLSAYEQMCRFAVFAIKTSSINRKDGGIDKKLFLERFGIPIEIIFGDLINKLKSEGLVEETETHINATIAGLVIAEELATMFYSQKIKDRLKTKKDPFGRAGL